MSKEFYIVALPCIVAIIIILSLIFGPDNTEDESDCDGYGYSGEDDDGL